MSGLVQITLACRRTHARSTSVLSPSSPRRPRREMEGVEGTQLVVAERLVRWGGDCRGESGPFAGRANGGLGHRRLARGRPGHEHGRRAVQHEPQGIGLVGPSASTPALLNLVGELGGAGSRTGPPTPVRAGHGPGRRRRPHHRADRQRPRPLQADPLDDRVEGCGGVRHGMGGGGGAGTGTVRRRCVIVQSRLQRFTTAAPERSRWTSDSTSRRADRTVLTVVGEVDVATSPSSRERLVQLIDDGRVRLVVDLTPVDFLDSTGLGVLVGTLKRIRQADGELRPGGPPGADQEALRDNRPHQGLRHRRSGRRRDGALTRGGRRAGRRGHRGHAAVAAQLPRACPGPRGQRGDHCPVVA